MNRARVFLVGPMGAGKTTVGKHLARLLHCRFYDLDAEIEERTGADIPWIFDVEGEEGFRKRESAMLVELSKKNEFVIATGGGVVLKEQNRQLLKESGLVIYLAVSPDILYKRTLQDTKRPLLQVENRREVVVNMVAQREPMYRDVAHIIYTSDSNSAAIAAEKIQALILKHSD